jgi:hypothetical protein
MFKKIILALLGLIVVAGGILFALNGKDNYDASKYSAKVTNGLKVGSEIEFTLPDQFDKSHTLTNDTKTLVLSFAKATGHTIKGFLNKEPKDYLPSRDAMFVADISPMPVVIRNTFALPDLRKSPFSVLLIYDKSIAAQIKDEDKKDKIIIVKLQNKKITSINYIDTAKELEAALNQ